MGANLLYWGGQHTEAGLIVRQMRGQGVKAILMGEDGISNSEFASISGPAGEGILMTSFPEPAKHLEAKEAVADLVARKLPPEAVTLYAFAATQILADGIQKAGKADPKAVAAYLHSGAPIKTVLGEISYDAKGDINQPGIVAFAWKTIDGKLAPVELK
jgi:branched-chain amino acid transport system substrate-binding protein